MKLLVTSDLHYNLPQFDWLERVAPRYDALVLGGDLLNIAGYLDLDLQITVISEYIRKLSESALVMVCSGNHDGEARDASGEFESRWLRSLGSGRILVDGDMYRSQSGLFTICPWWDGELSRERMVAMLEEHARQVQDRWIWIHHAPPDGCRVSWTGRRHSGDAFLNSLIERFSPTLVVSGHVHTAPFYEAGGWLDRIGATWVCNPGRQPGPVPTTIQLDLDAMSAVFDHSGGRETARLQ